MATAVERRVRRGATLLSRRRPGWQLTIDKERFDMGSCVQCVLGQLYGGFEKGLSALTRVEEEGVTEEDMEKRHDFSVQHGFEVDAVMSRAPTSRQYAVLQDAWEAYLRRWEGSK